MLLQLEWRALRRIPAREFHLKILAKEAHPVDLVRGEFQAHPDQVHMVGHQDIGRAEQSFASTDVKEQLAKMSMKQSVKCMIARERHT